MIRITDAEVLQLAQMRSLAEARIISYSKIYESLADLLQSNYSVPATDSTLLWLRGATEVNADRGAFSALIRSYTAMQYQLRYGETIDDGKMREASDEVAKKLLGDLLGVNDRPGQLNRWPKGQMPDITRISETDATAVGRVLFNRDLSDTSAERQQNSAWSGSLLFSLLRHDQTARLTSTGTLGQIDTLNDWRDVLYAYKSYEAGLKGAIVGAEVTNALALYGSPIQKVQAFVTAATDVAILGSTIWGYVASGTGDLQSALLSGTDNPLLKSAFGTIGNIGSNRFLDMLKGAKEGQFLQGTTTDANFNVNAKSFLGALTPTELQAIGATLRAVQR